MKNREKREKNNNMEYMYVIVHGVIFFIGN